MRPIEAMKQAASFFVLYSCWVEIRTAAVFLGVLLVSRDGRARGTREGLGTAPEALVLGYNRGFVLSFKQ